MPTKLCAIVALLTGKKESTEKAITEVYHRLKKPPLFAGLTKTYKPATEDGEMFPGDKQVVQFTVDTCLQEIRQAMTQFLDLSATRDATDAVAKGNVVVDGKTILSDVPVPTLLFLEKHLTDIRTEMKNIPVLDPQDKWEYDPNAGHYKTEMFWQHKTKKVPRNHVKAEATKEHPAQVEMYYEDVPIGKFETVKFSGAMPADKKAALIARIEKLRDAVKLAREEANTIAVVDKKIADPIFDYLLGK